MSSNTQKGLNNFKEIKDMEINELKRELSRLSGVDFFNPKYREVFKKVFPGEKETEENGLKESETKPEEKPKEEAPEAGKEKIAFMSLCSARAPGSLSRRQLSTL